MKRIVPRPTGHAFVIIPANPAQSLKVSIADVMFQLQELGSLDMEFLAVVLLLVVVDLVTEDRVIF